MNNKAFTLLELLIVILIIAVLATLAVPQYIGFIEKSRAAEAMRVIGMATHAERLHKMETGAYTWNLNNLDIEIPDSGYWEYSVVSVGLRDFALRATRTAKDASPEFVGQYISLWVYDSGQISYWCGTHVGVPRGYRFD